MDKKTVIDAVLAAIAKYDTTKQLGDPLAVASTAARILGASEQRAPRMTPTEDVLLRVTERETLEEAWHVIDDVIASAPSSQIRFYDLRSEQKRKAPKTRVRSGATIQRDPRDIDGVVIHQTATPFGVSKRQLRLAGGDRELALARRALNVACHAMAFQGGFYVLANELTSYVYHGHALNARSLGLEIDGRYPGILDDPDTVPDEADKSTWGGDPMVLAPQTIAAAREALRTLVEQGRRAGMPIRYVWAHRQSSPMRRSDPGEEIWRHVVLDYAVPELGLETQPGETWTEDDGEGLPVPRDWDPSAGVGGYWG